jgi:xylulokinase
MNSPLLLGLDIGTTHVKAVAFRPDGEAVAAELRAYPTYYPQPGWAEQSPDDWQAAVGSCLQELTARLGSEADRITALGLSAHAPGLIPVDAHGSAVVERVPTWQDERSVDQARRLLQMIGPDWVGLGMPFASFAAKLKWFTETQPALAREARYALGVKAYLARWLTGRCATDPSGEPGNTEAWRTMCDACGWSLDRLAPVVPATEVIGDLRTDLHQELGLKHPLPVVMGLNDGGSATLGNGAYDPGEGVITLATNGVVFLVSDKPVPAEVRLSRSIFCWPFVDERWIVGGQNKAGASSLQWFLGLLTQGPATGADFDRLLDACAEPPVGSHGVLFFPYLMGQGTPRDNPSASGAFTGLTMKTNRADLARAVLEGVAFTLRDVLDELVRIGPSPKRLNITGGGARSELWRQIIADVLSRPLGYSEADSCLGAAMLAAVGTGAFPDIRSACSRMKPVTQDSHPHPEATALYEMLYRSYGRISRDQAAVFAA